MALDYKKDFDQLFSDFYQSRWDELKSSLLSEDRKMSFHPSFSDQDILASLAQGDVQTKRKSYYLDPASVLAALALAPVPGQSVLDMCAAPGGKSLVLGRLLAGNGELTLNEFSRKRRDRLKSVIREFLLDDKSQLKVTIKGIDAVKFGMQMPAMFDRILLDAPCSGERHLIKNPKELEKWSLKRSLRLSKQQYALLCSGLLALRPGGKLLYSTCSISPYENERVMERLLDRKGESFDFLDVLEENKDFSLFELLAQKFQLEKLEYGYVILPDLNLGWGPIYFSLLQKK